MSYVLEALKRADAQRERGAVPGLNAQPGALPPAEDDAPVARRVPWLAGAAVGVAAVALLAWWLARPTQPPTSAASASAPVVVAEAPRPPVIATPAPVEPLRVTPKPPPTPPAPTLPAAPRAEPAAPAAQLPPAPAAQLPPGITAVPPRAEPASAPGRIVPLRELPEAVRRELPPLAVGGSMYSAQATQRLVILNGQVFHEGAQIGAELVVEQIRPKSVVLRFRQQRFEMPL